MRVALPGYGFNRRESSANHYSRCVRNVCVPTLLGPPVYGISSYVRGDVDACDCTRGQCEDRKRTCTENVLWVKNRLSRQYFAWLFGIQCGGNEADRASRSGITRSNVLFGTTSVTIVKTGQQIGVRAEL